MKYKKEIKQTPRLRFPIFGEAWDIHKIKDLFNRIVNSVEVEPDEHYQQIGIRSHGKGLFHKTPVLGKTLGAKRVFWIKKNILILNIVFAWEQAVAKTTDDEVGMIASHRFPMFEPKKDVADIDYFLWFFLTKKGKYLLEMASPGGAGRNKTLGQQTFNQLKIIHPPHTEQKKIAGFLSAVAKKIQQLTRKKELLGQYKKAVMQKIFSQEIRFKDENGMKYSVWGEKSLGEICKIKKGVQLNKSELKEKDSYPAINGGIEPSGYTNIWNTEANTVIISEGGNSCGYVNYVFHKFWCGGHCYALLDIEDEIDEKFLYQVLKYFENKIMKLRVGSGLPNIQKKDLVKFKLPKPEIAEQNKIAELLTVIDTKIFAIQDQLEQTQQFKKGLLQQMFV